MNLLFVLPGLYLNVLETGGMLQLWDEEFSTCVARHSSARGWKSIQSVLLFFDRGTFDQPERTFTDGNAIEIITSAEEIR